MAESRVPATATWPSPPVWTRVGPKLMVMGQGWGGVRNHPLKGRGGCAGLVAALGGRGASSDHNHRPRPPDLGNHVRVGCAIHLNVKKKQGRQGHICGSAIVQPNHMALAMSHLSVSINAE